MSIFDSFTPRVRPFLIDSPFGVVSFSFDDFARSALKVGGEILSRHAAAGTYYACGGLTGKLENGTECHSEHDIISAVSNGHEIGSHGYSHVRYGESGPIEVQRDIDNNQQWLTEILGRLPTLSFSYPFGSCVQRTKHLVSGQFGSARGILGGVNAETCDLAFLRANSLYSRRLNEREVHRLIKEAAERRAWLIFYTHDVSDSPTKWGVTPSLLNFAVREAVTSGSKVLPIHAGLDALASSTNKQFLIANGEMKVSSIPRIFSKVCERDYHVMVVIVSFRNPNDVLHCLSCLSRSTTTNFAVTVCENGGDGAYRNLIDKLSAIIEFDDSASAVEDRRVRSSRVGRLRVGGQRVVVYLTSKNLGYAGAVNVCLRRISSNNQWLAVWMLNPDAEPDTKALAALVKCARNGPYDIIGAQLMSKITGQTQSYGGGYWRPIIARGLNIGIKRWGRRIAEPETRDVCLSMNYVSGTSMFVTRECVEQIGLMDERYFLYCEEVDWCHRRGYNRLGYAPDAIVYHEHGSTTGSHSRRKMRSSLYVYLDERNKLLFSKRFYRQYYWLIVVVTFVLTSQYVFEGAFKNFFVALSGWFAGICGQEGMPSRFKSTLDTP